MTKEQLVRERSEYFTVTEGTVLALLGTLHCKHYQGLFLTTSSSSKCAYGLFAGWELHLFFRKKYHVGFEL